MFSKIAFRQVRRLAGWSVALLGGVALLGCTYPGGWECAFADIRDYSELQDQVTEVQESDRKLNTKSSIVSSRISAKELLTESFIAGQITFAELVAEFHALNSDCPNIYIGLRMTHPKATEQDLSAINAVGFLRCTLHDSKDQRGLKALRNAEDELERLQSRSSGH
jgi:hypothetical protein